MKAVFAALALGTILVGLNAQQAGQAPQAGRGRGTPAAVWRTAPSASKQQRGQVSRARSQHCCVSPEATPTDGVDCPLGSTAQVLRVGTFSAHRLGGPRFPLARP